MCAGYEIVADPEAIAQAFRVDQVQLDFEQRALFGGGAPLERFPRQAALIVVAHRERDGNTVRMLGPARFGLTPHFAQALSAGDKHYNARAETVHERPMFRDAFARHRCLVPVSAFYEWQRVAGRSQRYVFAPRQPGFLALAGIWDTWRSPEGQKVGSFAILTTQASPLVAPIHERMPVVLDGPAQDVWLSADADQHTLRALLVPVGGELLCMAPAARTPG